MYCNQGVSILHYLHYLHYKQTENTPPLGTSPRRERACLRHMQVSVATRIAKTRVSIRHAAAAPLAVWALPHLDLFCCALPQAPALSSVQVVIVHRRRVRSDQF